MKSFKYKYPWSVREEWFLPDDEEMMQAQFPILDEQIDFVLGAIEKSKDMNDANVHFRTCVQAGGAFGVYPRRLADYFDHVVTFEPCLSNLQCLAANVGRYPNIAVHPYALWNEFAKLQMAYSKPVKNSYGAHHVSARGHGIGNMVDAVPLDNFELDRVDLIWLDVEGSELHALKGASQTIFRHTPVVVIEEAKHLPQHKQLGVHLTSASEWLKAKGYKEYGRTHGDLVFIPA